MSFEQTRFSLMALPQNVDENGILSLNIVFIPRNINPLTDVNTIYGAGNKAKPFVNVQPQFEIRIANNPNEFPGKFPLAEKILNPVNPIVYSGIMKDIYTTLRDAVDDKGKPKYFDIDETRSTDYPSVNPIHRAPAPATNRDLAIRKYLPLTYRKSFNFTTPRIKNGVTDDSYHCAFRTQGLAPSFDLDKQVSWGKVYASLMRQPLMAKLGGLIYETKVQLDPGDFAKGGWLYVDLANGSDYFNELESSLAPTATDPFIKRYSARIPILNDHEKRSLFAAVLFPVVKSGESPVGVYDELFIEAARYNEGFATIVHAGQAVSGNILQEEQDGFHPQKESGIRLGWEDEQILIWYLRQLAVDEGSGERLDAPLGVTGYQIDVRNSAGPDTWESLTAVESNGDMSLETIKIGGYKGELPYQVYPTKVYDKTSEVNNYWLPMYFANWNSSSVVLPDKTAARIYQSANEMNFPVTISDTYKEIETNTQLVYGNEYQFRVRLSDISGGTPDPAIPSPANFSVSHIAKALFKRYVAPHSVTIQNDDKINTALDGPNFGESSLKLARPLLGYPAVVYTGKYTTLSPPTGVSPLQDVIDRLSNAVKSLLKEQSDSLNKTGGRAFGIPDPDVASVEIKVEVETLNMDNLASDDGREHYITLYKTNRSFTPFDKNNPEGAIEVPLTFKDVNVLNFTLPGKPFPELADNTFITNTTGEIILPTARNIRLTLRAVGEDKSNYWGFENKDDSDLDSRYGKTTSISLRQESQNEQKLFTSTNDPKTLQGIYLQPDPVPSRVNPIAFKTLQGGKEGMPDIVQRLGSQLNVEAKELTLVSVNGERLQFWCSNILRHSMAPDNSSITFSNKEELHDHWLVCTTLVIDRDWCWDSLAASSFNISRSRNGGNFEFIGDLELKKVASFQAIQPDKDGKINRNYTKIILIDVVDNKPVDGGFPETITVQYTIEPKFRDGLSPLADLPFVTGALHLPTTINPRQTPRLIAAGIALSPYNRNKEYSSSEARTRFLWLEFDSAPEDINDSIFCRVLAYSPDQLISNNDPSLMDLPVEPPISLDPEYIRVITPDSSQDDNGLDAMQEMENSTDTGRYFYLLPLPAGLHHESPELFGMFTYEFRYGHTDKIWSTAQGRFGRALRVAGLQHPAPTLLCMLNRNEKIISVNAPFATAVSDGRNVTANPPHTSIWALLYAQVKQADGLDYRNILLDELELKPLKRKGKEELMLEIRESLAEKNKFYREQHLPQVEITIELINQAVNQQLALDQESPKQAFGRWANGKVNQMLDLYGLPHDSPLSVLVVEVFGQISNINEHMDNFRKNKDEFIEKTSLVFGAEIATEMEHEMRKVKSTPAVVPMDPLNSKLGLYRILRTSPLTEVPFICTTV